MRQIYLDAIAKIKLHHRDFSEADTDIKQIYYKLGTSHWELNLCHENCFDVEASVFYGLVMVFGNKILNAGQMKSERVIALVGQLGR